MAPNPVPNAGMATVRISAPPDLRAAALWRYNASSAAHAARYTASVPVIGAGIRMVGAWATNG